MAAAILAALLVVLPLAIIVPVNAYRWLKRGGLEPAIDNLIAYIFILVVLGVGALTVFAAFVVIGRKMGRWQHMIIYAAAGASGSTALMTLIDKLDDYFTRQGVSWPYVLTGLVLGSVIGAAFSVSCYLWQRTDRQKVVGR